MHPYVFKLMFVTTFYWSTTNFGVHVRSCSTGSLDFWNSPKLKLSTVEKGFFAKRLRKLNDVLPCNGPCMNHCEPDIAVSTASSVTVKWAVET